MKLEPPVFTYMNEHTHTHVHADFFSQNEIFSGSIIYQMSPVLQASVCRDLVFTVGYYYARALCAVKM